MLTNACCSSWSTSSSTLSLMVGIVAVHCTPTDPPSTDLFAFVIKMPTMHRLSVFRDDFVFLIYLYQRYTYKVDTSRPAEK